MFAAIVRYRVSCLGKGNLFQRQTGETRRPVRMWSGFESRNATIWRGRGSRNESGAGQHCGARALKAVAPGAECAVVASFTCGGTCRAPPDHSQHHHGNSFNTFNRTLTSQPKLNDQLRARREYRNSHAQAAQELTMINAFLVFNGSGQPRLTKFYTQLASSLHHHHHRGFPLPAKLTLGRTQPCNNA